MDREDVLTYSLLSDQYVRVTRTSHSILGTNHVQFYEKNIRSASKSNLLPMHSLGTGNSYWSQDKLIQVLVLLGAAGQPHMWSRGSEHALEGINGDQKLEGDLENFKEALQSTQLLRQEAWGQKPSNGV